MEELKSADVGWVTSRLPFGISGVLAEWGAGAVLAGGFIRACIAKEVPSDVDIFVGSMQSAESISAQLAVVLNGEAIKTENAFTILSDDLPIQVIHRWTFDSPEKIVAHFDFTVAAAAIWWKVNHWASLCDEGFYPDLAARRLSYVAPFENCEPFGSLLRLLKFYERGYRAPLETIGEIVSRGVNRIDRNGNGDVSTISVIARLREIDPLVERRSSRRRARVGDVPLSAV